MSERENKEQQGLPEEQNPIQQDEEAREHPSGDTRMTLELYDWARALVSALVTVIVLFVFVARVIGVKGTSMVDTLHDNDKILLSNLFYEPEYGDIVVLCKKSFMDEPIVKRVIATEGQTVDINYESGEVWVDGRLLDEPYIHTDTNLAGSLTLPATVPEGHIFVMGDNRNASIDSRRIELGMVDERYILGKVLMRLFPFDQIKTF